MNEHFTGVASDPREDIKVKNGWSVDEVLAASAPVNWTKKDDTELVRYPIWNQHWSSACVAFSKAKQLSIKILELTGVWIDFSPASIYQLRSNKPSLGMHISDANDIVNKRGATLEALMKSQGLTEDEINSVKRTKVADLFAKAIAEAVVAYLYVPIGIDRIAQVIESKKAVSLLVFSDYDEYARSVPEVRNYNLTYAEAPIKHEIVAVDYFLNRNGEKRLLINDSAHFGNLAVREFTEEFLLKRCVLADVIDVFSFEGIEKPRYDGSIISLQKCLAFEGLFPNNVDFVEAFGQITQNAVMKFQVKYGLHTTGVPNVGPKTKLKLLELYP